MAITVTWKGGLYSTSNTQTTYTSSPTWTPTANSLLVALVVTTYSASPTDPTGVTGHGQTYTALTLGTSTLSTTHKLSIWVAKAGATPTSTAAVAAVTGTNGTGGAIIEFEVTGADVSGTALQAIVVSNATNTGTSTAQTVTLAAASHFSNRGLIFGVQLSNTAHTSTGTWTLTAGAAGNFNTPATGAAGMFANASFLTAGAMTGANVNWRMVGIEIKAAPPDGVDAVDTDLIENEDLSVRVDVSETDRLAATEIPTVVALITASDTVGVKTSEQSVPFVTTVVPESCAVGLSESASVDTGAVVTTQITASDSVAVAVSEGATALARLPLTDNFNDGAIDLTKWLIAPSLTINGAGAAADPTVTVVETGGGLQVTPVTNGGDVFRYNGLLSQNYYDFTGSMAHVEVVQSTTAASSADTQLSVVMDTLNEYQMAVENNDLFFTYAVAGVQNSTTVAYNSTTMRWWRIRHNVAADQIVWETSPDGTTWTARRTVARALPITSVKFSIFAGTYSSVAVPGVAIFDNFGAGEVRALEPLTVALTESPSVVATTTATDTVACNLSETTQLLATLTPTDALATVVAEQAVPFIQIATSDSLTNGVSEQATIRVSVDTTDTTGVQASEVATVTVNATTTDTLRVQVTEQTDLRAVVTVTDALAVQQTETTEIRATLTVTDAVVVQTDDDPAILASLTATDALAVVLSDVASMFIIGGNTFEATDTAAVALVEQASIFAMIAASDTLATVVNEATALNATLALTESLRLQSTEVTSVVVIVPASESARVQTSEQSVPVVMVTPSENVTVQASDVTNALAVIVAVTEALAITPAEAVALLVSLITTDSTRVVITPEGATITVSGSAISIDAADSVQIACVESPNLSALLAAADALVVGLTDATDLRAVLAATDTTVVQTTDTSVLLVLVTLNDAIASGATELATLLVRLDVDAAVVVVTDESPFGNAMASASDSSALASGDEPHVLASLNALAELLGLTLDEVTSTIDEITTSEAVALVLTDAQEIEAAVPGHLPSPSVPRVGWEGFRRDRNTEMRPTSFRLVKRWWR